MSWTALDIEAREMALQMQNGSRNEVRAFIAAHDAPATLALKIVRSLWTLSDWEDTGGALVDAVLNVQALLEGTGS